MNYKFDLDLKDGQIGEKLLKSILTDPKLEVKLDFFAKTTGNIAVEFKCRGKDSGIITSEAIWWCFALDKMGMFFIIERKILLKIINKHFKELRVVNGGDNGLSEMVLISQEKLVEYARCMTIPSFKK